MSNINKQIRTRCQSAKGSDLLVVVEDRLIGKPSHYYLSTCIDGCKSFGFDLDILADAYDKSKEAAQ